MSPRALSPGGLLLLLAGCDTLTGRVCTAEAVSGITVHVRDSLTGRPAGFGSSVVATDGAFAETLQFLGAIDSLTFFGVFERPGHYMVDVSRPGYRRWERQDVRVEQGPCHVIPVVLDVRLQPES